MKVIFEFGFVGIMIFSIILVTKSKKIFKLRSELLFFAIISVLISFVIVVFLKEYILGSVLNSYKNAEMYVHKDIVSRVENDLKNMNIDDSNKLKKYMDKQFNMLCYIFVVKKDGSVIAANNEEIKKVDAREISDGKKSFKFLNTGRDSLFKITRCAYLKNSYYLYYIYIGYGKLDDGNILGIMMVIIFSIVFFMLIWKRIAYISEIRSSIRNIAEGDLKSRIRLKYKNELGELAGDVNYMASKIENEEKNRNQFLTNISHDLRTPLTTIIGYINMIKNNRYDSKEQLGSYISIIDKKGNYLRNMLDDFFDYSKLYSGDVSVEKQKLEANEFIRQEASEEENEFIQNKLKLEVKLSEMSIYIHADPQLLLREIGNILSNAIKYSRKNTIVRFGVFEETFKNKIYAVFWVSNITDEYIERDDLKNFFERLYKKDSSRQKDGSGLGLAIVKNIARIHGGFVKACIEDNRLVFKIYHPSCEQNK